MSKQKSYDEDLSLFSSAMSILVKASTLKPDAFVKHHSVSSVGVEGYGNIDTLERLAGAMNAQGYRTHTGKYLSANYLKKIKSNLIKKYGAEYVADIVDWREVSVFPLDDEQTRKETAREIRMMNEVPYRASNQNQKSYYEWWSERYYVDPATDRIHDRIAKEYFDDALGLSAA